jgi:hypothetical protein
VMLTYQNIHAHINKLPIGDLDQLNVNIQHYLNDFNNKHCKELEMSRKEYFELHEKDELKHLPPTVFDVSKSISAKVQADYHFYLGEDKHYYSVPYKFIGTTIKVIYNKKTISVYAGINKIAVHNRDPKSGKTTLDSHRPEKHIAYLQTSILSSQDYIDKAAEIGQNVQWAMSYILDHHKDNIRIDKIAQSLLTINKHIELGRLEHVCSYIRPCGIISIDMIKNVLQSGIDLNPVVSVDFTIPNHDNLRGAQHYN